jgi:hypothetical protein
MSTESTSSHRHLGLARTLLAIVLLILCAGHFAFWQFTEYRANPFPAMKGLVVGSALASTVMVGAIWIRKPLARTALVVFLWIMIFVFSMPGLLMMSDRTIMKMGPLQMLGVGLGCYLLANLFLIVSASIHRLGAPHGCRG